jgi:hypothetical protein
MALQANHYIVTFDLPGGSTTKVDVYAKDDSDARNKVEMIHPTATNIVVASGVN